jgi:hypothetical protein
MLLDRLVEGEAVNDNDPVRDSEQDGVGDGGTSEEEGDAEAPVLREVVGVAEILAIRDADGLGLGVGTSYSQTKPLATFPRGMSFKPNVVFFSLISQ